MSIRVLLTGATGFVGRQIALALNAKNVRVTAVVRTGSEVRLPKVDVLDDVILSDDLFSESRSWWDKSCNGIDVVIHSAWYAEPGKYLTSEKNLDCLEGTIRLARSAAGAGIKHFTGIGTCFEYDLTGGVLSIQTPLRPTTPYAAAKTAAFHALSQLFPASRIGFSWCRLFYLFGEGEDPRRLVPYVRTQLAAGELVQLSGGTQIRDFVDVSEAGRQIVEASLSDETGPINVCSGIPVTVRQIVEKIADEYGRRDLLRFGGRPDNLVDPPCVVGLPGRRCF